MSSSFHHQGLWKFQVDLPPIAEISIQCPPSCASAVTQGARARGLLRNTVDIDSSNVIDYPADRFWDKIIASTSLSKVFIVFISGDLIRDRSEGMKFTLYRPTHFMLMLVFISLNC